MIIFMAGASRMFEKKATMDKSVLQNTNLLESYWDLIGKNNPDKSFFDKLPNRKKK